MNDIQYLIDRQLGIAGRFGYDNVLKRLVVREAEAFHGLGVPGAEDPPIFACRFAEASGLEHILALANEDGRVAIQNISKSGSSGGSVEGFQCHNNAVFDLAWMPGHMNFVTVSGDHSACLWDVAEGSPKRVLTFSHHTRSVKTAVFRPTEPSVFATGARDGNILLWDIRAGAPPGLVLRPDDSLRAGHSGFLTNVSGKSPASHTKRARVDSVRPVSITGLVFQDTTTLLSCGECDGNIKVWDLRKNYSIYTREPLPKHAIPYCGSSTRNGYTNLIVDAARVRLYASCMDNVIYCFNIATYSALPERRYVGHENATFYIKTSLSPDCRYLVSGSSDTHAYVWNVKWSHPVVKLAGHRAEVTCAAWALAATPTLVTCSDDARHMVWRVGGEEENVFDLRGRAELVPRPEPGARQWGAADRTPASLKRRAPPNAGPAKRSRPEPKTKRCLADLLNAMRGPEEETASKRPRLEPTEQPPTGSKRTLPPEPVTPKRSRFLHDDSENASDSGEDGYKTPTKTYENREVLSPRNTNTEGSPTGKVKVFAAALPDFVQDGVAPHQRLMSPGKRGAGAGAGAGAVDWLTRLARSKRPRAASPPPADPPPPPPSRGTPPTRRGSTSERTPKPKTRTLLKYFTVEVKEKV